MPAASSHVFTRWFIAAAVTLASAGSMSGCGYLLRSPPRPTPAIHYRWHHEPLTSGAPCLLVLLPGFLDSPEDFQRHGLVSDLHAFVPACDLLAVATHLYDYYDGSIVRRVHEDIIVEGRNRGYESVWLLGVSMGAVGAILTARDHPDDVDGLILISPYLGTASFIDRLREEVGAYGTLASWASATESETIHVERVLHDPRPLWRWLARYRVAPSTTPPLFLAYAHGDRFASAQRLLAHWTAPEHAFVAPGGHNWQTWRRLFLELVDAAPSELLMLGCAAGSLRDGGDEPPAHCHDIRRWGASGTTSAAGTDTEVTHAVSRVEPGALFCEGPCASSRTGIARSRVPAR